MTTVQLSIVCLTLIALVGMGLYARPRRPKLPDGPPVLLPSRPSRPRLDVPLETQVAVHLVSGTSVRGRVVENGDAIRLTDAEVMAGGDATPLGGVARFYQDRIDWIQELGA